MTKSCLIITLSILFCLTAWNSSVIAQDNKFAERYRLPVIETNASGEKCLNEPQWSQVILVASEYKGLYEWRIQTLAAIQSHQLLVTDFEQLVGNLKLQINLLENDRKYLTTRVSEVEKFSLQTQKSQKISVLGWKITAATGWVGVLALAITSLAR